MAYQDVWQMVIGFLVLLDTAYLFYKLYVTRDYGILSAILPRVWVTIIFLVDAFTIRATMEPVRSLTYGGFALLFVSANINHLAEWMRNK